MINKPTKREELSPQTLDLEKAQAAIRAIIKSAVLYNRAWLEVNAQISRAINLWTPAIEDEEFRERIKKSLYYYATIQYRKAKTELFGLHAGLLPYVVTIRNPKATDEQKRKAAEKITLANPQLQQIVEPVGRYWETAQPLNEYTETYAKRVEKTFRELADSEAKDSYSSNVSLRNVAEMRERSERQKEELRALTEQGEDLVWISTHGNCSERCEPWQGKLYSISGRSGKIDGKEFRPLSDATDIYYTTKSGKTYKNGCISGFNCRHFLIPYRKGNGPIHISAEAIEKERNIEKTQRYLERETRRAIKKSICLKEIDPIEAAKQRKKAKELYKKYVDYSNANKVAFYPWRCKEFDGEELINDSCKKEIDKHINVLSRTKETLRTKIKNGEYPLKVHVGKQNKHIPGSNEYMQGKSIVTISISEVQNIIDRYAGSGWVQAEQQNGIREIIETDKRIGFVYRNGKKIPTQKAKIHYSKKGLHIVPYL